MRIVAICISKQDERWWIPEIPFHCHTEGYREILHHDNSDLARITYLTERYNRAVQKGLEEYPKTEHILIVDSYYLPFVIEITRLVETYKRLDKSILGASIWFWDKSHFRAFIQYYDTLSVKEMKNQRWYRVSKLPTGLLSVTGLGGCFIFPRVVWERSGGFFIPYPDIQAGGSRCLKTTGYSVLLDCDVRLWRTHSNNPGIPDYPLVKRVRVSLGQFRGKLIHRIPRVGEEA